VNRAQGCPVHNFQRDGHMRQTLDTGRANYQPNSWGEGPRESPTIGYQHFPAAEKGDKTRVRPERFADHYSQARQVYISQTEVEQAHIAAALTFELSKVERVDIRSRMVAHLLNVHDQLATKVAAGLRLKQMPKPAPAAVKTRTDLEPSPALSILQNAPRSFAGRKVGVLVTDGVDAKLLKSLGKGLEKEGAELKIVAPMVGGVEANDGTWIDAHQKIDGGPSTVFDAVAILVSQEGAELLGLEPTARDFVSDAFAHIKFIGHTNAAVSLLEGAGVLKDDGVLPLNAPADVSAFVQACRKLRFWPREKKLRKV
jgi:catalase